MPPPGYEPFLRMVLDDPADDGPRMVYADWLEEHGDPRGEFIRVQLELARLAAHDPARARLADRETSLYLKYYDLWHAEMPQWAWEKCEFRRGFITEISVFAAWLRHFGEELSMAAPIEKIALHRVAGCLDAFAQGPNVRHLKELVILDDRMTPDDLRVLCRSPSALAPLRGLLFMGINLLDAGAFMLSICPQLRHLRRLELKRCKLGHRGVERLTDERNAQLFDLTWLDLSDNDLRDDSFWALASAPLIGRLEHLGWNDNGLTNSSIQNLANADAAKLTRLEVAGNHIGDAGARLLIEHFPHLQYLDLSRNSLSLGMMLAVKQKFAERVRVGVAGESS